MGIQEQMLSIYLYLQSLDSNIFGYLTQGRNNVFLFIFIYLTTFRFIFIHILYRRSHLAPDPIRSFMISKLPDSAQSWSAVFPFTDLRFTSAPMSIRYLPDNSVVMKQSFCCSFPIFSKILLGNFEVAFVAGDHETGVSVTVRHLDV